MTLLEATSTLIDFAKTNAPDSDRVMARAIKRLEKRLAVLQLRKAKSRRTGRNRAWRLMKHLFGDAPECQHCAAEITFKEFVTTAQINGQRICLFNCPRCQKTIITLKRDGRAEWYHAPNL